MKPILAITIAVTLAILLAACEAEQQAATPVPAPAPEVEPVAVDIAAQVNGEVITRAEVEQMALEMFGEYQASAMDDASRAKLLDSMVSTVALAQKSLAELSDEERVRIENKTRRYRENLLVSEYLRRNAARQPVTESMIQDYYKRNPQRFGAAEIPRYQLLTTRQALALDQRNAFLKKYAELKSAPSLQAIHQGFQQSGFDTLYQTGVAEPGLLSERLQQIINNETPGKLSDLHYLDDKPYLVLVDEVIQTQPQPLSEVRSLIRKTLAMAQLKQAVKELSEQVTQEASITIEP
jgi:hypothetical protein